MSEMRRCGNTWQYCDGDCAKCETSATNYTVSDYISRQAAMEALAGWKISPIVLDPVPAADVVEVVRCKDCKHYDRADCPMEDVVIYPDDFCSYGERVEA